jgi:hypothetical protein
MSANDLKKSFNEVSHPQATCMLALLEYESSNDTQFQILYFSGNYADGSGFSIKSNRIRPNADVNQAARETAARLLDQKRAL